MAEPTEEEYEAFYRACDSFGGLANALYGPPRNQVTNSVVRTWEEELHHDAEEARLKYDTFIKAEESAHIKVNPELEVNLQPPPIQQPPQQRSLPREEHVRRIASMLPPIPPSSRPAVQDVFTFVSRINQPLAAIRPNHIFSARYDFLSAAMRQAANDRLRFAWTCIADPATPLDVRRGAQVFLADFSRRVYVKEREVGILDWMPRVLEWVVRKRELGEMVGEGAMKEAQLLALKINIFQATLTEREKSGVRRWIARRDMEEMGEQFLAVAEPVDGRGTV